MMDQEYIENAGFLASSLIYCEKIENDMIIFLSLSGTIDVYRIT